MKEANLGHLLEPLQDGRTARSPGEAIRLARGVQVRQAPLSTIADPIRQGALSMRVAPELPEKPVTPLGDQGSREALGPVRMAAQELVLLEVMVVARPRCLRLKVAGHLHGESRPRRKGPLANDKKN